MEFERFRLSLMRLKGDPPTVIFIIKRLQTEAISGGCSWNIGEYLLRIVKASILGALIPIICHYASSSRSALAVCYIKGFRAAAVLLRRKCNPSDFDPWGGVWIYTLYDYGNAISALFYGTIFSNRAHKRSLNFENQ